MLFALFPLLLFGQENDAFEKRWEEINKGIEYNKSRRPKGPEKEYIAPQNFDEETRRVQHYDVEPRDEDIKYSREKRYNNGKSHGVKRHIKEDENQGLDDLKRPKSDAPRTQKSNKNRDFGDGTVFKYIFIIIAIVLVVFLIYYFFFKNPAKTDQKIESYDYSQTENINPEIIEKSQLETDLEKAIAAKDYRSAVRIYYILLLKALISKGHIKWVRRKTNTHYLAEMTTNKEFENFNKAVNMYEWTWYGKNNPSKEVFERFAAFYDNFLSRLKDE